METFYSASQHRLVWSQNPSEHVTENIHHHTLDGEYFLLSVVVVYGDGWFVQRLNVLTVNLSKPQTDECKAVWDQSDLRADLFVSRFRDAASISHHHCSFLPHSPCALNPLLSHLLEPALNFNGSSQMLMITLHQIL